MKWFSFISNKSWYGLASVGVLELSSEIVVSDVKQNSATRYTNGLNCSGFRTLEAYLCSRGLENEVVNGFCLAPKAKLWDYSLKVVPTAIQLQHKRKTDA